MKVRPSILSIFPGLGPILVGVFSILWSINYGAGSFFIFIGFPAWIVSVALKIAWAAPTNKRIKNYLDKKFSSKISGPIMWAYIGLLTGIFECGIILLFVVLIPSFSSANWPETIGFGIAYGAAEAIILGIFSFGRSLYCVLKPPATPQRVEQAVWLKIRKYPFTMISAPIVERIAAILLHLFTTVLIVVAFQQNAYYLFWISFFFKSFADSVAAWATQKFNIARWKKQRHIWFGEFLFVVLGVISIFGTIWLSNM
jgi:uncharacterized membrane protein YhfC